jgi:hypothetical protein
MVQRVGECTYEQEWVWERRGKWRRMEERRGKVRKRTDVPLHCPPFKGVVS